MTLKKQILLGGACVAAAGIVVALISSPSGGVRLGNEMDKYALRYLEEHKLLDPSEELVAYYDATIGLSGTEAAILTTKRVLYHKDGRTDAIDLSAVEDVKHRKDFGDIIEIYAASGKAMKIEIAPMNQGETFLSALQRGIEKARSGAGE